MKSKESGAVAVEFALVIPILILLIGGLMVLGFRAIYASLAENQARTSARHASIRSGSSISDPYPTEAQVCGTPANSFLDGQAILPIPGAILTGCDLVVKSNAAATGAGTGDIVTVALTYEVTILQPLATFIDIDGFEVLVRSASVMRE